MDVTNRQLLDVTVESYHQRTEISSGMIRTFRLKGPYVCHAAYVSRSIALSDSDEKRLGRAFHKAMEKGRSEWLNWVTMMPTHIETTESMSEAEKKHYAEHGRDGLMPIALKFPRHRERMEAARTQATELGLDYLDEQEAATVESQVAAVYAHPVAAELVGRGRAEVACIAQDPETGLWLRALADLYAPPRIVDFKTTRFTTPAEFISDAYKKGYVFQGAHYLRVFGCSEFYIITVTSEPPFESMVYKVAEDRIYEAMASNQSVLREMAASLATNQWHTPGWGDVVPLEFVR